MKKINLLSVLLTGIIVSSTSFAAVPTSALVQAESVEKESLIVAANEAISLSLSTVELTLNPVELDNNSALAKKKDAANQNKPVTLTQATRLAD